MLAYLLLAVAQVLGLLIIPLGWPGVWFQLGALALFGWWAGFDAIGIVPFALLLAIAILAELADGILAGGRMGAPALRRSALGGVAGACIGAALGLPFPLLGSVFGAFVGALLGSMVAAFARRSEHAPRPSVGQLLAVTVRTATGVVVAVFALLTLIR